VPNGRNWHREQSATRSGNRALGETGGSKGKKKSDRRRNKTSGEEVRARAGAGSRGCTRLEENRRRSKGRREAAATETAQAGTQKPDL